eukprot:m51a1_g6102 putative v-type proton atpase catalytic subunit a (597) ;mRNA; r:75732-78004
MSAPPGDREERESDFGLVTSVSGTVVVAERMYGSALHEVVRVGSEQRLMGEVVRLDGDTATIQAYEPTSGLCVGDLVQRTHGPLCVELGPGLLDTLYDGAQRPLRALAALAAGPHVPRGARAAPLDRSRSWEFVPRADVRPGSRLGPGDVYGSVRESALVEHRVMLPPGHAGAVAWLAPAGSYTVADTVLELEEGGATRPFAILSAWPVRVPRPVGEQLPLEAPLLTGQRVLDALFPCAQGGTCALPGPGSGILDFSLCKYSNSDVVVHVACAERGNEVAEDILGFETVSVEAGGRREPLGARMATVANTADMPLGACEASLHTGAVGLNATLVAFSTSRWAEALADMAGRLGEQPADGGYPAGLGARLAEFYGRAGRVACLGSPRRTGSLTVVGALSPRGGDYSDPVAAATLGLVQTFWATDRRLMQRKHFPAVSWSLSFSRAAGLLEGFYGREFAEQRDEVFGVLRAEEDLAQAVARVGRAALGGGERATLEAARLCREVLLQQNCFLCYDRCCPLYKTRWMMRVLSRFRGCALGAARAGVWDAARAAAEPVVRRIETMKFQDPADGEEALAAHYAQLLGDVADAFRELPHDDA